MKRKAFWWTTFVVLTLSVFIFVPGCSGEDDEGEQCLMMELIGDWCWTDPCDGTTTPNSPAVLTIAANGDVTYTVDVGCDNITTGTWTFDDATGVVNADFTATNLCDAMACYQDIGLFSAYAECEGDNTLIFYQGVAGDTSTFTRCP
jgi:hypothetical protein